MSELPRRLSPGTRLSAHWLNRLLDWLRSRDLRAGRGVKITRTPSGTTISVSPATETLSEDPMPFDCRVEPDASGSLHWRCYLPRRDDGIVRIVTACEDVEPPFLSRGMPTLDDDWYDVGQASKGDVVTLYLLCSYVADTEAEKLSSAVWAVAKSKPDGRKELGALGPSVPVAEWADLGPRQIFHGPYVFGGAGIGEVDTDVTPVLGLKPGMSIDRYLENTVDTEGPLQLRQFSDVDNTLGVKAIGETIDAPDARNLHLLMRLFSSGSGSAETALRPMLVYVSASGGPFWVKGGTSSQNYGESIRLGSPTAGWVTISVS